MFVRMAVSRTELSYDVTLTCKLESNILRHLHIQQTLLTYIPAKCTFSANLIADSIIRPYG